MIERSNERCCLVTLSITLGSSLYIEQQNRDCGRAMGASHSPPNTSVSPGNRTSLAMWEGPCRALASRLQPPAGGAHRPSESGTHLCPQARAHTAIGRSAGT